MFNVSTSSPIIIIFCLFDDSSFERYEMIGLVGFLKYKFIYFNWRLITLQYCIGFSIHQHESATGIPVFSILNPSSLLPPCTIPLGHPSAPALSILYHALNMDWHFISHMILYMFQCHSPKSSHPFPLSESKILFHISMSILLSGTQG